MAIVSLTFIRSQIFHKMENLLIYTLLCIFANANAEITTIKNVNESVQLFDNNHNRLESLFVCFNLYSDVEFYFTNFNFDYGKLTRCLSNDEVYSSVYIGEPHLNACFCAKGRSNSPSGTNGDVKISTKHPDSSISCPDNIFIKWNYPYIGDTTGSVDYTGERIRLKVTKLNLNTYKIVILSRDSDIKC